MSLLAEEIVEEWLNRKGYFTIRGIKIGVDEIDILAIKPKKNGDVECRHIEVTASTNPISYISRLPKHVQKASGRSANTSKRTEEEIKDGVIEWVTNKYDKPKKSKIMQMLYPAKWSRELVVHKVRHKEELKLIRKQKIKIYKLADIVEDLKQDSGVIQSACGTNLMELIQLSK